MCIIVAKKKGIELPSENVLENCFENNFHGAGIAIAVGTNVHVFKGLMTWERFRRTLNLIKKKINLKDHAVAMHFRIATHGSVIEQNTQPFPVSDDMEYLTKVRYTAKNVLLHNGFFSSLFSYINCKEYDVSDTLLFTKSIIYPLSVLDPTLERKETVEIIRSTIGSSKIAILKYTGDFLLFGDFIEDEGIYYSNTSYMETLNYYDDNFKLYKKYNEKKSRRRKYRDYYSNSVTKDYYDYDD